MVAAAVLLQARREGFRHTLDLHARTLAICLALSVIYMLFLAWIVTHGQRPETSTVLLDRWSYWVSLAKNIEIALIPALTYARFRDIVDLIALGLCGAGIFCTLRRNMAIAAYFLLLFVGQLAFSTFVAYGKIAWFHPRYLTSCFVAFAFLGALGYEFLVATRKGMQKWAVIPPLLILSALLPVSARFYLHNLDRPPLKAPYTRLIEDACPRQQSSIYCSPERSCRPLAYVYRHSDTVTVRSILSLDEAARLKTAPECTIFLAFQGKLPTEFESVALRMLERDAKFKRRLIRDLRGYPELRNATMPPDYLSVFEPDHESR
jgi:hypothetical protein